MLVTTTGVGDTVGVLVALVPNMFRCLAKYAAPRMIRISNTSNAGSSHRGVWFGSSLIVRTVLTEFDYAGNMPFCRVEA